MEGATHQQIADLYAMKGFTKHKAGLTFLECMVIIVMAALGVLLLFGFFFPDAQW